VSAGDAILDHCRRLPPEEVERLVGWLAWRLGRNQALAGAGTPLQRLEHVTAHWLDDGQRERLHAWLVRRAAAGRPAAPA